MEALVDDHPYEMLERAIGATGQAIIDGDPGSDLKTMFGAEPVEFDTQRLGDAILACFSKGHRDSTAIKWHSGRVEAQIATGALEHIMAQLIMAAPPRIEGTGAHVPAHKAVDRFKAGTGFLYSTPSIEIASKLDEPTHSLHPVKPFLLKAQNTITEAESEPGFSREGHLEVGGAKRDPKKNMPTFVFADSLHHNTHQLVNQVIVLRALAYAVKNNGNLPPTAELRDSIRHEIGELALLTNALLGVHLEQLHGRSTAKEVHANIRETGGSRVAFDLFTSELNWEVALWRYIADRDEEVFDRCSVASPLLESELPKFDYRRLGRCFVRFPWRTRAEYKERVRAYFSERGIYVPEDGSFSVAKFLFTHSNEVAAQTIYPNEECREVIETAAKHIMRRQGQIKSNTSVTAVSPSSACPVSLPG